MSNLPYYRVNVFTGTRHAAIIEKPEVYANIIKKAKRPLLVLGPQLIGKVLDGKPLVNYVEEMSKAKNIPIVATANTKKMLLDVDIEPSLSYDIIEIINALKDNAWTGVRGEGQHDLIIFWGIRCDLAERGLSTLKHFAPHLKTLTLCRYLHPNSTYSLPNFTKIEAYREFIEKLIESLKEAKDVKLTTSPS